jgi:hypothetical protein
MFSPWFIKTWFSELCVFMLTVLICALIAVFTLLAAAYTSVVYNPPKLFIALILLVGYFLTITATSSA